MLNQVTRAQVAKEAERINAKNMALVKDLEETFNLQGLVFMDNVNENELPLDDMTYMIIETGDYTNALPEQRTVTETVTITFWSENRENPTLDKLTLIAVAKEYGLRIVSSDNQNIILTNTDRNVNMFILTLSRGVKIGVC